MRSEAADLCTAHWINARMFPVVFCSLRKCYRYVRTSSSSAEQNRLVGRTQQEERQIRHTNTNHPRPRHVQANRRIFNQTALPPAPPLLYFVSLA